MKTTKIPAIRLLVLTMLLTFVSSLCAQRERNYIYILDCSNSMIGNKVWDPSLKFLEKSIGNLSDNSMVTIIPFQGNVFQKSVRHGLKSTINWHDFKQEVDSYTKLKQGTNICKAWNRALTYIDPNKDNYICLLTDGEDNMNPPDGTGQVCKLIRDWCEQMKNVRGYYVALSPEAANPRIIDAVNNCQHMTLLTEDKDIDIFGEFEKNEVSFNTLDPHDAIVNFSAEGDFPAIVLSTDSLLNVSLVDGLIKNGRAKFHFSPKMNLSAQPQAFFVDFTVESKDVKIINPNLRVLVKNIPERTLQLPFEEIDLGEVSWYDSFWPSKEKKMDTLKVDLNPQFNESATQMGAHIKLQFTETTKDNKRHMTGQECELLFNGKPCPDGRIDIDPGKPAILSIIPNKDSEEGKHYYSLKPVSNSKRNLETINQEPASDYNLTLRSNYDIDMNPLKWAVIIICFVLLALLILWFLILRPLKYPTIRLSSIQMECQPIYKTPHIKGCRRVVFTNRRQQQGMLSRIFTGEVKYITEEFWDKEWSLVPGSKKTRVRALGTSGYSMNPPGNTIEALTPVEMKSLATGKIIRITLT